MESCLLSGIIGIEVLMIEMDDEVEFVTIMTFESVQNVMEFQWEYSHMLFSKDI